MKQAFAVAALGVMLVGCGSSTPAISQASRASLQANALAHNVSIAEAKAEIAADPKLLVLDVREPAEYAAGHVPQAINRPMSSVFQWYKEIDPKTRVLCLCRSGHKSGLTAAYLANHGFDHAETMVGGMTAWVEAGYPMDKASAPRK